MLPSAKLRRLSAEARERRPLPSFGLPLTDGTIAEGITYSALFKHTDTQRARGREAKSESNGDAFFLASVILARYTQTLLP